MSELAKKKADWLVDAVACATQDRSLLRGEPGANDVLIEAIMANGEKAVETAISSLTAEIERLKTAILRADGEAERGQDGSAAQAQGQLTAVRIILRAALQSTEGGES